MSDAGALFLSVVIPTHNRRESLLRTLEALAGQTIGPDRFEVVVVIDAGTDDTPAALAGRSWPFALHQLAAEGRGPAAARNTGARYASAGRILFLDDDIVADPCLLAAHLDAADGDPDRVVVGQSAPVLADQGWLGQAVSDWWKGRFRDMSDAGYRFGYTDVMSGNLSLARDLFLEIGGFDESLLCREDYELGYRLVGAGKQIVYAAAARGLHYDATTRSRNLSRARAEGAADLQFARKFPELFAWFRVANMTATTRGAAVLRLCCFAAPVLGRGLLALAGAGLPLLEAARLRQPWQRLNNSARALSYQLGVAAEADGFAELERLRRQGRAGAEPSDTLDVDLLDDLPAIEEVPQRDRPAAVILRLGDRIVGRRHAEPGLEPLGARHLNALLGETVWTWALPDQARRLLPPPPADDPPPGTPAGPAARDGIRLGEVDLEDWSIAMRCGALGYPVKLLVRFGRMPLGWIWLEAPPPSGSFLACVRRAALADHGICRRLVGLHRFPADGDSRPPVSVVVCTRDRTDTLRRCLAALRTLDYPDYEVVVVDNAPTTTATRDLVAGLTGVRYVREDRPGLDWARNRGVAAARHDIIAFTDDDTEADRHWLSGLADAFADPAVDFVTGLVAPMKLDTTARLYFENVYGGMGKGFDAVTRDPKDMWPHDLLWASALGVGANMAFRRGVFDRAGRFDPALDVGTATCGGGDIEMFHRALARGCVHVYQPAAFVWHEHRADLDGLRRQLSDNGSGFASYLLTCARNRTVPPMAVLRFALRAWLWDWQVKRLIRPGRHLRRFVLAEVAGLARAPRLWRAAQDRARELAQWPDADSLPDREP